MEIIRATRAYIHIDSLLNNLSTIRGTVPPGTPICAAVKADAYGHGAIKVAVALREAGVEYLGVATPFEGRELREAGDTGNIILYGPTTPEEISVTVTAGIEPLVPSREYLKALEAEVGRYEKSGRMNESHSSIKVHLKVDTGMGRIGCRPDEAPDLARLIDASPRLKLAGIATHFPVGDSDAAEDLDFTRGQIAKIKNVAEKIESAGINPGILHAANSGGIRIPEAALGMVRPGIALYGYGPGMPKGAPLRPVMEVKTKITAIKKIQAGQTVSYGRTWRAAEDAWIATLPVGYADGYSRLLSNRARVLIAGRTHPVVGTICMDQTMVHLDSVKDIDLFDEATLFGPDTNGPNAEELAGIMGTISYEITCGVSRRVPRIYID